MKPGSILHLLAGTGVLLGLGVPLARMAAAEGISALPFTFWPTLAAGIVLALVAWRRHGTLALNGRLLRFGAVSGIVGHALPVSSAFWLTTDAGASFAALAFTMPPVFTLLLTLLVGSARLDWRRAAAVTAGLAGALLIVTGRGASFEITSVGMAVALLIPTTIAVANVYRAIHLPRTVPPEWLGALMMLWSAAALAVMGGAQGDLGIVVTAPGLFWLGLQTLALTFGYLLYFVLQKRAEPVVFSFIGYAMMGTGVAVATLAFGERLPPAIWPGLLLIAAALWLVNTVPNAARRPV